MKFIGLVSTVNLADISPGGETKSGSLTWRLVPATTGDPPLVSATFLTFLYSRLVYALLFISFLTTVRVVSLFLR